MSVHAMDFRHLRYFVCVADQGSFRAAASRLNISQPALTRQVQQVEEMLGQSLLVRNSRGVELTEAGRVFHAEAHNLLSLMDQVVSRSKLAGRGEIGHLDIGIFGSGIFVAIPRIVRAFSENFPGVKVALHTMDRSEQVTALRERRLTLGFDSCFNEEPDLKWQTIMKEKMHVALHESHALASAPLLTLADIAEEPLVLYPRTSKSGATTNMLTLFHRRQLSPQIVQEVDDVTTAIALVANGFGASLVAESACSLQFPGVVFRPLAPADRAEFDLCMIYRENDESVLLSEFIRIASNLRPALSNTSLFPKKSIPEPVD